MKQCEFCGSIYRDELLTCPYCGKQPRPPRKPAPTPPKPDPAELEAKRLEKLKKERKKNASSVARGLALGLPLGALLTAAVVLILMSVLNQVPPTQPPVENIALVNFRASMNDVYIDTHEDVVFTVNVVTDAPMTRGVGLYDQQNNLLATMNDNGVAGDAAPNDGIYSAQMSLYSAERARLNYHAACGDVTSDPFEINYYSDVTQNEFAEYARTLASVSAMTYEDANQYIASAENIEEYRVDEANQVITYRMTSGIVGVYEVLNPNLKGSGMYALPISMGVDYRTTMGVLDGLTLLPAHGNPRIAVLRPFHGTQFQYEDFREAGEALAKALNGTVTVIDDENVTLDAIQTLMDYDIVLIDSHGNVSPLTNQPYIITGERFDEQRFMNDPAYLAMHTARSADYLAERIYGTSSGSLAVTGRFFEKYYPQGSLDESFWFLGTCKSLYNNRMSDALVSKGAQVVMGFTNSVSTTYCNRVLFESVMNTMILSMETAGVGVSNAQGAYGVEDPAVPGTRFEMRNNFSYKLVAGIDVGAGMLSGRVCEASDRATPVPSAAIQIYRGNTLDTLYATASANEEGNYSIELPAGDYYIHISADGHIDFNAHAVVNADENTYMETFLLIQGQTGQSGVATGRVSSALTGIGIEGVQLEFIPDWNSFGGEQTSELTSAGTGVTDSSGNYSIELPIGNYTAVASCEGYLTASFNIVVQPGSTPNQNGSLTPIVTGDNYLITLTWGDTPSDLDSHLEGTASGGRFHVLYSDRDAWDNGEKIVNLDVDDRNGYGPEHITLTVKRDTPYYYYVHRYSYDGVLANSGAKVTIHQGNILLGEFNVPTDQGSGIVWNVFAIKNGRIIISNTITENANTDYAN